MRILSCFGNSVWQIGKAQSQFEHLGLERLEIVQRKFQWICGAGVVSRLSSLRLRFWVSGASRVDLFGTFSEKFELLGGLDLEKSKSSDSVYLRGWRWFRKFFSRFGELGLLAD